LSSPSLVGGVDDGFFEKGWRSTVLALALMEWRGGVLCPRGARLGRVSVDGLDATSVLSRLVGGVEGLRLVLLDNVVYAGFNLVEPWRVFEETGVPVVVVLRYPPRRGMVESALRRHFRDWELRLGVLEKVWNSLRPAPCPRGGLLLAPYGLGWGEAVGEVCGLQVFTRVPEPLYMAHVVASGVSRSLGPEFFGLK